MHLTLINMRNYYLKFKIIEKRGTYRIFGYKNQV